MPRNASRTAQLAALARAALHREKHPPRCEDHLAEAFLTPPLRVMLRLGFLYKPLFRSRMPGTYEFLLARSLFFDACTRDELDSGVEQVVILGAGLDTRAYRFPRATFFEVDAPATSSLKQERVRALYREPPAHVRYVQVDFTRDDLRASLLKAGFRRVRTLFLWEGVTFYIPWNAIRDVLTMVREESAPGSAIVFDHLWEDVVSGPTRRYGAQKGREFVAKQGEPFMFGFRQGEVAPALSALGFTLERLLEPADQQDLIRRPDGSVMGRISEMYGMVLARVAAPPA
ncbi:class I SAM-dependent methyltransferase [Pyxidicoccus fallax]|uniref:S-adenosyl-L-methionine-dependent methyltransferase n=1 Tax=Pyxidicoccus fallax TaxID=394095 RepID=A0A848LGU1_9BACT|nr:SAM-dependent methyltransferase [Pyxidicoccus fallax]NMO16943.1 class I SAM-dependent methyltransferase [Pyxidicoccus fallax]NPC81439.1 class I SAM-dependent methyltransferase [Pyxidicoccus fallax]